VSANDVIEGKVVPDRVAGRLVLLGTSAIGLLDVKTTPVSAAMPGVEIQARLLESALTDSLLSRPNYAIAVELLAAVLAGAALARRPDRRRCHAVHSGVSYRVHFSCWLMGCVSNYRMLFAPSFPSPQCFRSI
jgi:CHASE2 domain-containing sensor protein